MRPQKAPIISLVQQILADPENLNVPRLEADIMEENVEKWVK